MSASGWRIVESFWKKREVAEEQPADQCPLISLQKTGITQANRRQSFLIAFGIRARRSDLSDVRVVLGLSNLRAVGSVGLVSKYSQFFAKAKRRLT